MRLLVYLLFGILFLASILAAQTSPIDSTRINVMAKDSTGQVWGIGAYMNSGLYRWDHDRWNAVAGEGLYGNNGAAALATGPDGAVYCLWGVRETDHSVTWHRGSVSKTLAHFTADVGDLPSIFVDPKQNIWITGRGIQIYRITPEGKAESVYTIEYDHRFTSNLPRGARMNFEAVFATADGQGHVWFWAGGPHGGGIHSLDGILIFDGEKFELHSDFPVAPNRRYTAVAPDDGNHIWLAADHLYRVDTRTFVTEVVPEPERNAFRYVQQILHVGGATYLVTGDGLMPVAERSGGGRIGVLWRQDGQGWKRVVNGLDMRSSFLTDAPRSFVVTPAGLWVGAYGTGPWFLPEGGGEAVHIDWRYGFSLESSEGLATLPDGRLLVAGNSGTRAFEPKELLASSQSPEFVQTLNPLRVFVADQQNHLWGFIAGDQKTISEWNGRTWKDHALPEDFEPLRLWNFGIDSHDRWWILQNGCQGRVTLLDAATDKVETYPDFSSALQAQLADSANFQIRGERFTVPTFTADGRIGYRDGCQQVHYFNTQIWQSWRPPEVDTARRGVFDGPAFFDRAGNFAVNIAGRTWEYEAKNGWRITAFERGYGSDQERLAPYSPLPLPGCSVNPDSIAEDRLGTYWLTAHGQLYRAISGICVPQFSPSAHQPFGDLRTIKAVLIDPEGNAFLETYLRNHSNFGEYVIVKARPPLPQTKLHAIVEASGFVKLQFGTQLTGKAWFTWRVDGGKWNAPSTSNQTELSWLANGKHTIEAAALDEHLQIDPHPPTAEVTIQVDTHAQIAALIEQLKDHDYAVRDAAVAGLVRQPALALPQLQAARANADADQRWWIDAAIQQVKDALASGKQP